jgi:hypothetical protein
MTFEKGPALERRLAVALAGTANFREGIAAFLEKRPASWQRWHHRLSLGVLFRTDRRDTALVLDPHQRASSSRGMYGRARP